MADQPDFLDRLQTGRDAMRKLQKSVMRLGIPAEQRQAFLDSMGRFIMPGDQLQAIVDLIDAFGPPLAQIEAAREEIADQREDLDRMQRRLATLEATLEPLAESLGVLGGVRLGDADLLEAELAPPRLHALGQVVVVHPNIMAGRRRGLKGALAGRAVRARALAVRPARGGGAG